MIYVQYRVTQYILTNPSIFRHFRGYQRNWFFVHLDYTNSAIFFYKYKYFSSTAFITKIGFKLVLISMPFNKLQKIFIMKS